MSKVCVKATIEGRVQGVFYRQSTVETANRLGITGWVRNRPDGCVEAMFEGERTVIEEMLGWCWQGPPAAEVTDIMLEWQDEPADFESFRVVY